MSGYPGPRCCKRAAWIAIEKTVEGVEEFLNIKLVEKEVVLCTWQNGDRECLGSLCKYGEKGELVGISKLPKVYSCDMLMEES